MESNKPNDSSDAKETRKGNRVNEELYKYGRGEFDRINFLLKNLSEEEKISIATHIHDYGSTVGSIFNTNSSNEVHERHRRALTEIDKVFISKFGIHIVPTRHQNYYSEWDWMEMLRIYSPKN